MTVHYPIVFETEADGAVSAYVPGLPVYAAADSHANAERAIRGVLMAYLEAHPGCRSHAQVRVARFSDRHRTKVDIVGVAALVGARRSASKARASRANGRLGGRPVKNAATARRAKSARRARSITAARSREQVYSSRSAAIGSTRVARWAGRTQATIATNVITAATLTSVAGSVGRTSRAASP